MLNKSQAAGMLTVPSEMLLPFLLPALLLNQERALKCNVTGAAGCSVMVFVTGLFNGSIVTLSIGSHQISRVRNSRHLLWPCNCISVSWFNVPLLNVAMTCEVLQTSCLIPSFAAQIDIKPVRRGGLVGPKRGRAVLDRRVRHLIKLTWAVLTPHVRE